MTRVFIDGSAGTTGLRLAGRLRERRDIELLVLTEEKRKDPEARRAIMNRADIVFLCLPDAAAVESVSLVDNPDTVIIDTSTAHRTAEGWTYGFPELTGQRERIAGSRRIANPGCHASGVIALLYPLIHCGMVRTDTPLSCFSLTGYSGGGKKMIADYESQTRSPLLDAPRTYGISQSHKHLPEIVRVCGLETAPLFFPIVGAFYSGMEVVIGLHAAQLNGKAADLMDLYRTFYDRSRIIHVDENADESGFLSAAAFSGRDDIQISVAGGDERIMLTARFDNLGKGASGSALQNMNILMGIDETTGLVLG
ncbi:MAG: N-acetyl-gamma-glutamyl-phosphate reductase [Clostridia bacterium]|nr:N-acetyl-gamma-glutamyl-phosphate reductase [Clostridia bacterium]